MGHLFANWMATVDSSQTIPSPGSKHKPKASEFVVFEYGIYHHFLAAKLCQETNKQSQYLLFQIRDVLLVPM